MKFFSNLFGKYDESGVSPELLRLIHSCDLDKVQDNFRYFVKVTESSAKTKGDGAYYIKPEFVAGWTQFYENPSKETLTKWAQMAPEYQSMIMMIIEM